MGSGCPESRRGSIPQGVLFDSKHQRFKTLLHLVSAAKRARKREKLSIGRSGTNRAHKFADGKTMADDKTQLGRHIWQHTVISGAPIPRRRGSTPRAADTFI
nr:MAG TPA: hypothetical protein [Caudoviricetes sp.]